MSIIPSPASTGVFSRMLSGSAGTALRNMGEARVLASHIDETLLGIQRGSNVPALASHIDNSAISFTSLINDSRSGLRLALGAADQPAFSATLHASGQNIRSQMGALGRAADWSGANPAIDAGSAYARSIVSDIDGAMPALESAAARTMLRRAVIGGIGLAGAAGGAALLYGSRRDSGDEQIIAPGPLREQPGAPDLAPTDLTYA